MAVERRPDLIKIVGIATPSPRPSGRTEKDCNCTVDEDVDYFGGDLRVTHTLSAADCCSLCLHDSECRRWTMASDLCYLKTLSSVSKKSKVTSDSWTITRKCAKGWVAVHAHAFATTCILTFVLVQPGFSIWHHSWRLQTYPPTHPSSGAYHTPSTNITAICTSCCDQRTGSMRKVYRKKWLDMRDHWRNCLDLQKTQLSARNSGNNFQSAPRSRGP